MLGNTQTFLGTIATLAILCLFAEMRKAESGGANSNFIFQLIAAIGSDVIQNLKKLSTSVSNRAKEKITEIYKICDVEKNNVGSATESYLFSLCYKKDNNNLAQKLSLVYKKIDMVSRRILDYAELNKLFDGQNQKSFVTYYSNRQESQLMALMVFLSSMLFLFIDIFDVSYRLTVPFTWLFLFYFVAFSLLVWKNHFSHSYEEKIIEVVSKRWIYVLCGLACLFLPSLCFTVALYLPFGSLTLFVAIIIAIIVAIVPSNVMYFRYWNTHDYTRTIVLKHLVYFCVAAIIGVWITLWMESSFAHDEFEKHITFFTEPLYVRYVLYSVLLLNLIIIPLYGGYLHMKIDEWIAVSRVKNRVAQYDKQLEGAIEELHDVINEIKKL